MENLKLHNPTLRVINILTALYKDQSGLSFTDISDITKISKGTLYPILTTLLNEKFLHQKDGKFFIGKNSFKIGNAYVRSLSFIQLIRPYMKKIVFACDEICQLGVLDGRDVLYVEKTEPKQSIRLESYVGKSLAAHATALGKCLLSSLDDKEISLLYKEKNSFYIYTNNTIKDIKTLLKEIENIRINGYAREKGESNKDIECIAVPIKFKNEIIASLSVSLPLYRSNEEKIGYIIEILKQQAYLIEKENLF